MVIEELETRHAARARHEAAHCQVSRASVGGAAVTLARPLLYMNQSGPAVRALLEREEISPEEALVVCDDFHLDFGTLRLRRSGSHGGHNGLRSIAESMQTTGFPRLRIGIGPAAAGEDQADFVLGRFPASVRGEVPTVIGKATDCVEMVVRDGWDQAMNQFNRRPGDATPGSGTDPV